MFDVKEVDYFDCEDESFDTILEPNITFKGNIKFSKPLMIRGKITGKIDSTSDLVVDKDAVLNANVDALRVLVKGKVTGNIYAKDLVFVASTGNVEGDITAKQVVLEPGSTFSGKCTMIK